MKDSDNFKPASSHEYQLQLREPAGFLTTPSRQRSSWWLSARTRQICQWKGARRASQGHRRAADIFNRNFAARGVDFRARGAPGQGLRSGKAEEGVEAQNSEADGRQHDPGNGHDGSADGAPKLKLKWHLVSIISFYFPLSALAFLNFSRMRSRSCSYGLRTKSSNAHAVG